MRASCETDLARQFPLAVVAKWLGNTQAVAMRHDVDVTDADFEKAVKAGVAQNAAQHAQAGYRGDSQSSKTELKKARKMPNAASSRDTVQMSRLEAAGIEPANDSLQRLAAQRLAKVGFQSVSKWIALW
jgi:hypothetical protein